MSKEIPGGQTGGKALLIQRAGISVVVNDRYDRWLRQGFIVLPIFIVCIGNTIPPYNVAVLGLGGAHRVYGLPLGQTVERQAGAVGKCANNAPRGEKLRFTHKNTSFLNA